MKNTVRFIRAHRGFTVLLVLAFLIILFTAFPSLLTSQDPAAAVMTDALQAPSKAHPFGTDNLGRDLYTRVIYGARTSVPTAFLLVGILFGVGSLLGILAGYFGGFADALIMRIADIMISFPGLVLAMAIVGILGPNLYNAVFAIAAVSWPKYARLARSLVLKIRQRDYVAAAELTGSRTGYILWRYMFRLSLPILIVTAATDIGKMMLEMAALSFLGFGAQPPTPEWGLMLNEGRLYMQRAPWLMIFPGLAMFFVVCVFNLIGDSLRDLMDTAEETGSPEPAGKWKIGKRRTGQSDGRDSGDQGHHHTLRGSLAGGEEFFAESEARRDRDACGRKRERQDDDPRGGARNSAG